jgi:hypothetical protein
MSFNLLVYALSSVQSATSTDIRITAVLICYNASVQCCHSAAGAAAATHVADCRRKELQDTQIAKTMQQNAALTWLDGAPATMAKHC